MTHTKHFARFARITVRLTPLFLLVGFVAQSGPGAVVAGSGPGLGF